MKYIELHDERDTIWVKADSIEMIETTKITTRPQISSCITLHTGFCHDCIETPEEILQKIAVDAVPVMRCKDCKHFVPENELSGSRCAKLFRIANSNDYCSFGKRKEKTE